MQDAWHAEGDFDFADDDGGYSGHVDETEASRPPSPPRPPSPRPPKQKAVPNPYATPAHLDLHAHGDDDSPPSGGAGIEPPPGRGQGEGLSLPGLASGPAAQQQQQPRGARPALRRPSKSTMGFSAASRGVAPPLSGLAGSSLAARLREKRHHQTSNKILGAGRGHGPGGEPASSAVFPGGKTGSWSSYDVDMGPDTQVGACSLWGCGR